MKQKHGMLLAKLVRKLVFLQIYCILMKKAEIQISLLFGKKKRISEGRCLCGFDLNFDAKASFITKNAAIR